MLLTRAEPSDAPFIPGLMVPSSDIPSPTTTPSPSAAASTSTAPSNPVNTIHHNVPLLLCIVIGGIVVTATLSVGLAWILRLACCAGERRARRRRKLDRRTWDPSTNLDAEAEDRHSFDSVTVTADDDLEGKDAKIDALFNEPTKDTQFCPEIPVLTYADGERTDQAPKSTWNGRGWTLFDPPVASLQAPQPAARGGGDYGAANQALADRDVGGFTWPSSVNRQPSFIERLVQRHHQAPQLPTTASLPYPFQPKPSQPASRMASLGGAANRAMMNMLPVTLRVAATTASRQRATTKRYRDMQPYLDSDFEGTIGCKDRELPMARRLRRTEERMAVDWTTEEEGGASPLVSRIQPALLATPVIDSKVPVEFTPGLAGLGAAWSKGPRPPPVVHPSMATSQLPKVIEPNRTSLLPFPPLEGDRRSRLLGNVGRWLGQVIEAGSTADPYTPLSPRPDRRITKTGSLRSDYTSTTLAGTNSDTHVDARTSTTGASKSERLLERVDADQAEHDRQQRRLLRKARLFTPAPAEEGVSRAPSIRPQFFATTDLTSWLEPARVSTTHGFKVLEEGEQSSVGAEPFASDAERKPKLRKYESYDSLASQTRQGKAKRRSSSAKQRMRSAVPAKTRSRSKNTGRQKRQTQPSRRDVVADEAKMLPSKSQSSAAVTVMSSVFDEVLGSQPVKPTGKTDLAKGAEVKAGADKAMQKRGMPSMVSHQSLTVGKLTREESTRSAPSVYSELTAPSDYAFRAPLWSNSTRVSNSGASETDADSGVVLKLDATKEKQAKKEAKRESKRTERQSVGRAAADPQLPRAPIVELSRHARKESTQNDLSKTRDTEAMQRLIKKQRSISLGAVRHQLAVADHDSVVPDSPWTSSDSDISMRRWGQTSRDPSLRDARPHHSTRDLAVKESRQQAKHGRSISHFYGMAAGGDLRDLC